MVGPIAHRAPWGAFPDVIIHAAESAVKNQANYPCAKAGDVSCAQRLVEAFIDAAATDRLRRLLRPGSVLLPVVALEEAGVNRIPAVMAAILGDRLGLPVDCSVVQINTVGHTGATGWQRMARQALFGGCVQRGAEYVLVDDFVGQGGTLANLRGYLLAQGGAVHAATVLTGKPHSVRLALTGETLERLRGKHGEFESWWQTRFGYGFDRLTESEARYLVRAEDADTIRNRIAEAGRAADD
jgi:hypothetical protein